MDNTTGDVVWVAKDVAEILGYKDTINAIKQHCRGVVKHHPIVDSLGRTQQARVIHEPDLYRLIANSKLESAQKFEQWIFEEVLPSIRRTGTYAANHHTAASSRSLTKTSADFKALKAIAMTAGLEGNAATISANAAMIRMYWPTT